MTEVLNPNRWSHRLRARWRALWGFCPRCNGDAPHLYQCPICRGDGRRQRAPGERWWADWRRGVTIYLCYYQLHVDSRTFYVHVLVDANDHEHAIEKLESQGGRHYHLQAKGCLGEFTPQLAEKYMYERKKRT